MPRRREVLGAVSARPALVVATPGAEPVAEGGYAAALLLDAAVSTSHVGLDVAQDALARWLAAAALVRPATAGGQVLLVGDAAPAPTNALVRWDPALLADRELDERVELSLPPAVRVAAVTATVPPWRRCWAGWGSQARRPCSVRSRWRRRLAGGVPTGRTARRPGWSTPRPCGRWCGSRCATAGCWRASSARPSRSGPRGASRVACGWSSTRRRSCDAPPRARRPDRRPLVEASADANPDRDPAPAAREIDAVLYDFGNVLVGWDPYGAYDGVDRRDVDAFFADVDFRVLNHERDAGATWQDARDRVAATHRTTSRCSTGTSSGSRDAHRPGRGLRGARARAA